MPILSMPRHKHILSYLTMSNEILNKNFFEVLFTKYFSPNNIIRYNNSCHNSTGKNTDVSWLLCVVVALFCVDRSKWKFRSLKAC